LADVTICTFGADTFTTIHETQKKHTVVRDDHQGPDIAAAAAWLQGQPLAITLPMIISPNPGLPPGHYVYISMPDRYYRVDGGALVQLDANNFGNVFPLQGHGF
jgi:hypothetical protein